MFNYKIKKIIHIMVSKEGIVLMLAFIAGGLLRFFSAWDNLWFDEIWSVEFARLLMHSFWDVFKIRHGNNHILNTLYLYLFGFGSVWSKYRLLSIITGSLSVPLIGYIGFKRGFLSGLIASLLAVFSFPLIVYSSEARGYAPAILFALTAYVAFQNYNKKRNLVTLSAFWMSSILGILSHLTFLYIFVGFILSSIFRTKESLNKIINPLKELVAWHAVPSCFMVFLYLIFVKGMFIDRGVFFEPGWGRLSIFLSPVFGLIPELTPSIIIILLIFMTVSAWILIEEVKISSEWMFYAFTIVAVPVFLSIAPLDFFGQRYVAILLPFLYLILSFILVKIVSFPRIGIIVCFLLVSLYTCGNIKRINDQLNIGRGNHLDAVQYIMFNTQAPNVRIVNDHPVRNSTIIKFYKQFTNVSKDIEYFSLIDVLSKKIAGPEWLVMHGAAGFTPSTSLLILENNKYKLVKISLSANILSGWSLFVYQKQSDP